MPTTTQVPPAPGGEVRDRAPGAPRPGYGFGELALLVLSLTVFSLVGEAGARVIEESRLSKDGYSPVRGHRSHEPINAAGYRDFEHTIEKPAGVHRALFLGDSFTYGVGIPFDDTYPERTERALSRSRGERWESVVMAVPGIGSEQEAVIAETEGLKYSPDLVVMGYVLNDAEDPGSAEERRGQEWREAEAEKAMPAFWRRSALLRLIEGRLRATRENRRRVENHLALYRDGASGFEGVKRSIERISRLCRERRIPFVVAIFPLFANPLDERYPFASIHEKVSALCRKTGVSFVDLLPYYRGMDWRLLVVEGARDEHPNELAQRIAAQALLPIVESVVEHPPREASRHPRSD